MWSSTMTALHSKPGSRQETIWDGVNRLIDAAPGIRDLQAHGLHLLAARRWREVGKPIPGDLAFAELWAAFRVNAARTILERIRLVCPGPLLVIKGPAVASRYPSAELRPFLDLDLLVRDPEAAQSALLADGFEAVPSRLHPETVHHLQPLQLRGTPLSIELHRRPKWIEGLRVPDFDELLEGAAPAALGVDGILTLPPPQHALVLTAHLWAHDPLARLLRVLDVAVMAEAADPQELEQLVGAWKMERSWRVTSALADALFRRGERPLPLRLWARNLTSAREASILRMHAARILAPFSIQPVGRAVPAAGAAVGGLLRPQPYESWRGKIWRTVRQIANPRMRTSEHARAVATIAVAEREPAPAAETMTVAEPEPAPAAETMTVTEPEHETGWSGRGWPVASILWAAAACLAVALDADVAVRAPIVVVFLLVCPGLALVRLIRIPAVSVQLSLGIALSMALDVLVPALLLYAGAWSPPAALATLAALTVAGAVTELVRRRPTPA
jgi:hypothetical protein